MYREIETLIENAKMKKRYNNKGDLINYVISPSEGYMLHEKSRDEIVIDENGNETGEVKKGYTSGIVTVLADYDFEKNERQIYTVRK